MIQKMLWAILWSYSVLVFADDTVLKFYRPFGDVVDQVAPAVKRVISGHCDTQSQLILREDAWRCEAEGKVYDPCFEPAAGDRKQVLCPQSPWVGDSVQINVVDSLKNNHHQNLDMSRVFPWAVELANGEHCQAVAGSEFYDSMPVHYRCSKGNVLIGYLQRCKASWSMLEKTPEGVVTVEVVKAWF